MQTDRLIWIDIIHLLLLSHTDCCFCVWRPRVVTLCVWSMCTRNVLLIFNVIRVFVLGYDKECAKAIMVCGPGDIAQAHMADEWVRSICCESTA